MVNFTTEQLRGLMDLKYNIRSMSGIARRIVSEAGAAELTETSSDHAHKRKPVRSLQRTSWPKHNGCAALSQCAGYAKV